MHRVCRLSKKTGRACITRRITAQFTAHSSRYFSSPLYPFFFPYPRICTAGDAGWAAGCNVRPYGPAVLLGLNVVGADVPQDGRDGHLFGGPGPAAVLKIKGGKLLPGRGAEDAGAPLFLSSRQADAAGKAKFLLSRYANAKFTVSSSFSFRSAIE
jgi:hypothetical protein